ncbi:hypothetical protein [Agromyces sp. NBRC 114283]|uniref:hypothetical protein n=1 Tax=Agromyces sp. NBRC 114283 TaxID=2994521 RepID=UPI002555DD04|nr:hypothetical protein [Agromyces sp. NBRC 114283]
MTDIYSAFRREEQERFRSYRAYVGTSSYEEHLRAAHASLNEEASIDAGNLVQWKTFLRGAEYPDYGTPAIVVKLLDNARSEDRDGNPIAFPQDVFIGYLDGDQDFNVVLTSTARLMLWEQGQR